MEKSEIKRRIAGTIDQRIEFLREVVKDLRMETQPDDKAEAKNWNVLDEIIDSIESGAKKVCFDTWMAAYSNVQNNLGDTYDKVSARLGTGGLKYLPHDNKPVRNPLSDKPEDPEFVLWMQQFAEIAHNALPRDYPNGSRYLTDFFKDKYYDHGMTPQQAWSDYTTMVK